MRLFILFVLSIVTAAIVGIDLGHQFTKAVLLAPGVLFEPVLTSEGKRKDLSSLLVRQVQSNVERAYGNAVGSLCTRFPASCLTNLKAILGEPLAEIDHFRTSHYFSIVPDHTRLNGFKIDTGDHLLTVEEAIAMSLHNIKTRALVDLSGNSMAVPSAEDVALAVPPYSSQEARQAYLDALHLANFSNVLGLFDEGTAVALNYLSNVKLSKEDSKTAKEYNIVFDMGDGSTKATLFSVTPSISGALTLEIEAIGYDQQFGGLSFTQEIHKLLLDQLKKKTGLLLEKIPHKVLARLLEAAEKTKLVLSANNDYHVHLEALYDDSDFKAVIKRDQFEKLIEKYASQVVEPILKAKGDLKLSDVKSIILTGGSTRVPFVLKQLYKLVGEDKISKNVNADESCALGTTNLGFRRKSTLGASDIIVIDKGFHDFGIEVNGASKTVYPSGSIIGNSTKVNLSQLTELTIDGTDVEINLLEDGSLFKKYTIDGSGLKTKDDKLTCKSSETKGLIAEFSLDNNKLFSLLGLSIECIKKEKKGGLFLNLLKKGNEEEEEEAEEVEEEAEEVEEAEDEDVESVAKDAGDDEQVVLEDKTPKNSTKEIKKPKTSRPSISKKVTVSIPKPQFVRVKPLSNVTKDRISQKLLDWKTNDEQRVEFEHYKNLLEAQCYDLRSFIEDHEENLVESGIKDLETLGTYVSEAIEWLEFDSDESPIEEIHQKISELQAKKAELSKAMEIQKVDLSFAGIQKMFTDGIETIQVIESNRNKHSEEVEAIKKRFEELGFDFEKEHNKLVLSALVKASGTNYTASADANIKDYEELLAKLSDAVEGGETKFAKIAQTKIYELYNSITEKIVDVLMDLTQIEKDHQGKMDALEDKLKLLTDRKAKKEYREKLRQEEKEKAKLKEDLAEASSSIKEEEEEEAEESHASESSKSSESSESSKSSESSQESKSSTTTSSSSRVRSKGSGKGNKTLATARGRNYASARAEARAGGAEGDYVEAEVEHDEL